MVVARPTSTMDLYRMRTHRWRKTDDPQTVICSECSLEFNEVTSWMQDLPDCPGSEYVLKKRVKGKHLGVG